MLSPSGQAMCTMQTSPVHAWCIQALEQRLSAAAATLSAPLEEAAATDVAGSSLVDIREEYDEALHGGSSAGQIQRLLASCITQDVGRNVCLQ